MIEEMILMFTRFFFFSLVQCIVILYATYEIQIAFLSWEKLCESVMRIHVNTQQSLTKIWEPGAGGVCVCVCVCVGGGGGGNREFSARTKGYCSARLPFDHSKTLPLVFDLAGHKPIHWEMPSVKNNILIVEK